ncbi:hypothetical protein [Heyndrickxia coagulans]|uniref:hypothetical protein n=1 Tax=Heyndrickxia coagulans TaxID=1398 RepID=UPI000552FE58|nr:hypothetical protein [Heyndrickxia coagulans]MCR2847847.1 hypothetical protein [Heyndrickxia coagulans]MDR4225677.1 hypothetical protein [Heyndrickxia coagulans DSM 1 = ATCC 7050]MED4495173.1 hypothetical protein [Heyndrickxia coagulans]MED4536941.1 hypothetical protein [Heyndrickxia coagulans]QJE33380.1 hypothetical protein HHU11_12675 [Heyndrickxia coagulans]
MCEKIIRPKSDESLWQWEGTRVSHFACHQDSVEELIRSYEKAYSEQGFEVVDTYVVRGIMNCAVKLLIKPLLKYNEQCGSE